MIYCYTRSGNPVIF